LQRARRSKGGISREIAQSLLGGFTLGFYAGRILTAPVGILLPRGGGVNDL